MTGLQKAAPIEPMQAAFDSAGKSLTEVWLNFKATKKAKKTLEKILQQRMEEDGEFLTLMQEEKQINKDRRTLTDRLGDVKHQKLLMMREVEEYGDVEDFVQKTEGVYLDKRDKELEILAKKLAERGIIAEVSFRSGDLNLVVSRSK